MLELSEQLLQAIDTDPDLRLIDPRSKKAYVLVGAVVYDRVKSLLADRDDIDMRHVAALVGKAMAEDDADDPTLEYYQRTYGRKL